jgi:S1-C subfamily serine protease
MRLLRALGFAGILVANLKCVRVIVADGSDVQLVDRLQHMTVELVRYEDENGDSIEAGRGGTIHAYCAGTWVSKHEIITAAHCPEGEKYLYIVMRDDWKRDWITVHVARETVSDEGHDLAALRVDGDVDDHPVARIRHGRILPGETAHVVGSPNGFIWSYSRGFVAQMRPKTLNFHRKPIDTLQINVAIAPGSSGGGAFDADGNLIGVASWLIEDMPNNGFFVAADEIELFASNLTLD